MYTTIFICLKNISLIYYLQYFKFKKNYFRKKKQPNLLKYSKKLKYLLFIECNQIIALNQVELGLIKK